MEKRFFTIIFLLVVASSLTALTNLVLAGPDDFWKSCCQSGCDKTFGESVPLDGTTYYCCGPTAVEYCNKTGSSLIRDKMTDNLGWKTSCTYADDDSICGDPNWLGGGCTGQAACAGKVAGGTECNSICQAIKCTGSLSLSITGTGTCTITATVSVANCSSSSVWQVKDDGTVKCSGTGNVNNYNCGSWSVSSGSSGTTYTYNLYINDVKNDTESKTCHPPKTTTTTTTIGTTTTTIGTTTTLPTGCGNGICEYSRGETQNTCPEDCKTVVNIVPSFTYPRQEITVIVYFNDSRFDTSKSNYDAKVDLTIDGQVWSNEYCPINGKRWRQELNCNLASGMPCHGKYMEKEFNITTSMGYGYIEARCVIPPNLAIGTHILTATPTIYSVPITLRAAETQINILDGLYTFAIIIKNIFNRLTGLFIHPSP